MSEEEIEAVDPADIMEVVDLEQRASLIDAAANARSVAMLTGTHGVVAAPLDRAVVKLPPPTALLADHDGEPPDTLAGARVLALAKADDPVGLARAYLDLARVRLDAGDVDGARAAATHATEVAPWAHAFLRVIHPQREALDAQLAHVEALAAHAAEPRTRADWLAEKGRLLVARDGAASEAAEAAFSEALASSPTHAGALYGQEVVLDARGRWAELADHFGRLAAIAGDPETAAWLHVERALLLDRRTGDVAAARVALDQALALSPKKGPVRTACLDHAVLHADDAELAALLESEADLEEVPARAARLELDAALAHLRARGDSARALRLLERAHNRAPTTPLCDRRVAAELTRLLQREGRHADVLRVRKAAARTESDGPGQVLALRAIAAAAERTGQLDDAVLAIERARVIDADDSTLLEEQDRLLVAAGRHEARAVLWMREAALLDSSIRKARAFANAAEAAKAAGRDADAIKYMQTAWVTDPGAAGAFDALAERLAPSANAATVEARVRLYEEAAAATTDLQKRLLWLEKIAWLWDDVACDASAAARAYDAVLEIDPTRRSAITGMVSAAARAGDAQRLVKALLAEAKVTDDARARAEIRLRAAQAACDVDAERALALASELVTEGATESIKNRAEALVTRLHTNAGRWELVAKSFAARAESAKSASERVALSLAWADTLRERLAAPERALEALAHARKANPGHPGLAAATVAILETSTDATRVRAELETLAEEATEPAAKAALLVRAAEIEEAARDDAKAVALHRRALAALPEEPLVQERLLRLGAREATAAAATPFLEALRAIETERGDALTAEPLLAQGESDIATLRLAERLARRARSAPQLANALSLAVDSTRGAMAMRAAFGVATLVAWTLPESGDAEPWERLFSLGSNDVAVLDDLVRRHRQGLLDKDPQATHFAVQALLRRLDAASDDTERAQVRQWLARLSIVRGSLKDASLHCHEALACDPLSVTAASMLAEVATELGDRAGAITAAIVFAEVVVAPGVRAGLLRDAADLAIALGDAPRAAGFLERALEADPDAVVVAARLAQLQIGRNELAPLAAALRRGLRHATTRDAIVPMASELADVAKRLRDPMLAIEALERACEVAPDHVPALFLLAELYIGQHAWQKALAALGGVIEHSSERDEKTTAMVGRASIYARALSEPALAERELRAVLALDPHEGRALRGILRLETLAASERVSLLERLIVADPNAGDRLGALLELAELRRVLGDAAGAEGALVEAASISPDERMLARVRDAAKGDTQTLARVLGRALGRARESGAQPSVAWLLGLGRIEVELGRMDEAVERFEEVLRREPQRHEARLALARALAMRGRHESAATALSPLIEEGSETLDPAFVRLLDETLSGAGRTQQAIVARELRAVAGDLDDAGSRALLSRRAQYSSGESLPGSSLRAFVMPAAVGKHAIWEVAALTHGIAGKLARIGLSEQGASSRDRIKPKAVNPLRQLFDRMARAFDVTEVELVASDSVSTPLVAVEDVPWVVVPSGLSDWPEPHAIAALARPLARIALGVPWAGALPAHEVLGILVALARQVAPNFMALPPERIEPVAADVEPRARKAVDRKKRRALEDIAHLLEHAPPITEQAFADALARTESRAAFLVSGDLRASLDALAVNDATLADAIRVPGPKALRSVLGRPLPRDLVAYALSGDATALRGSIGTLWS